jgi:hypothetical protein
MYAASVVLFFVFLAIAAVDGFFFHIYRYRLFRRPDSQLEHAMHTANAAILPLCTAPLLLAEVHGAWLWAAVGVNVAAFVIESVDVASEKTSRRAFGGLTRSEYWMHFTMSGLRWMHVGLALAIPPAGAWLGPSTWRWLALSSSPMTGLAWGAVAASLPIAALHLALIVRGRRLLAQERVTPPAASQAWGVSDPRLPQTSTELPRHAVTQ